MPSPPYSAVMLCRPTVRLLVLKVAWPAPLTAPVPNTVVPSLKVTVPVRVPAPGATTLTCAVKVTDWKRVEGLSELLNEVVVEALLTV